MHADGKRLLGIYLNDHLAFLTGSQQLARRCRSNNAGDPLQGYLAVLIDEIGDDIQALRAALASIGEKQSRAKVAVAKAGERLGRLKLNGRLTGYSPLSRVIELEQLGLLRRVAASMWAALQQLEGHAGLDPASLGKHAQNATSSQLRLEEFLKEAVKTAFQAKAEAPPGDG